ncbi:MAG: NADH-quinone oxidoreductase subunit C, partial [Thermoplasmatota archaeon]
PSQVKPAKDQATADPTGPRAPPSKPGSTSPTPIEPGNVGKPLAKPATQTDAGVPPPAGSKPTAAPTAATAKPGSAPGAPKPAAAPVTPAPEPQGDYAMLRDAHASDVVTYETLDDGVGVLHVTPEGLLAVASEAKAMGYTMLSLLSAYDRGDHFGVLYAFTKLAGRPEEFAEVRLRVTLPKKGTDGAALEPECPSLVPAFKGADWQEREMYDMYGIRFLGHPDLRRMFLPDGWSGWPMRKDYKEPEQFVAMRDGEDIVLKQPEEGAW